MGFLAVGSSLVIYSRKERSRLLLAKTVQDLAWLTHYLLLGCLTPAVTSGINISRSIVFSRLGKGRGRLCWLAGYLLLYPLCLLWTWKDGFSLLPVTASMISTVSFFLEDVRKTKCLAMAASCVTLLYNLLVSHSLSVYVGVTLTVTTSLVSLLRSRGD